VRGSAEYRLAMLGVLAKRAQRRATARLFNGKTHG
jgi:CO/xanthine dehydrogenase FAD-binding subunit